MKQHWTNVLKFIIPYLIIVGLFQVIAIELVGLDSSKLKPIDLNIKIHALLRSIDSLGTALIIWIFVKYVDKITFMDLGFNISKAIKDSVIGLLLGFVIMFIGFITLLISKDIYIETYTFFLIDFLLSILIFVFVSFSEELLIRGYILQNLQASMNNNLALTVSSALFSLFHFPNPHTSLIGFINLFLAGVLLGLCYLLTKNLWLPLALHFSWNFFQGSVFGFNVSGIKGNSIIEIGYQTETVWNGGSFGFEGSILCTILQIIAILFLKWLLKNRLVNEEIKTLELN